MRLHHWSYIYIYIFFTEYYNIIYLFGLLRRVYRSSTSVGRNISPTRIFINIYKRDRTYVLYKDWPLTTYKVFFFFITIRRILNNFYFCLLLNFFFLQIVIPNTIIPLYLSIKEYLTFDFRMSTLLTKTDSIVLYCNPCLIFIQLKITVETWKIQLIILNNGTFKRRDAILKNIAILTVFGLLTAVWNCRDFLCG